jgi:DMSO/TMAO reductase YedYZ heme-binding membrane subunit
MLTVWNHTLEIFSAGSMVSGSGLAAYILLFLVVAGGMLLSMKLIPVSLRVGFLSYHRLITGATAGMLLIHGVAFFIDKYQFLSLWDVLVPFWTKHHSREIAAGIIAVYTMGMIAITSLRSVMKKIGWGKWRIAHYLAFPCYLLALWHSVALGKSSNALFMLFLYPATVSIIIALTALRVWKAVERRQTANESTTG